MICIISVCASKWQFVGIWRKGRRNTKEKKELGLFLIPLGAISLVTNHRIMKPSET